VLPQVPEKVGMKPIQREGVDYEFTIVLELDIKHNAVASKDRTGLFMAQPEFKVNTATGKQILDWCNSGIPATDTTQQAPLPTYNVTALIAECTNVEELRELYYAVTEAEQQQYRLAFNHRKEQLSVPIAPQPVANQAIHTNPISPNGRYANNPSW
jgi:hypothetical protein